MEYDIRDLKRFFIKLISKFMQSNNTSALGEFMDLLNKYAQYLNARNNRQLQNLEGAMNKNNLLQSISSLFARFDLNEEFNAFLPLQSRGVSLLAEVQLKDPQLHKEIIMILKESEEGESIPENEFKIKELLSRYPEWRKKFEPYLQQNSQDESDNEESKSNLDTSNNMIANRSASRALGKKKGAKVPRDSIAYPEIRQKSKNEDAIKNYDIGDRNDDESDELDDDEYGSVADNVTGRNLSKNEMMFFDDLKKILDEEALRLDDKNKFESLFDVVMKAFTLYVDGV